MTDTTGTTAVLRLARHASAAAAARRFLAATLSQWRQPAAIAETAELLASELTGNAIRHGRGAVTVTARLRPDVLRVEVNDSSHNMPRRPKKAPDREHGRGLWIVDALSSRWGAHLCPGDGKDVWFELDTSTGPRTDVDAAPQSPAQRAIIDPT